MKQKVTFQNSKGLKLVGVFHIPERETKSIIIISHGFAANKDRLRIVKTAEKLCKSGFAVFRFDFGGCGDSEERPITVEKQIDDLKSAIDFVIRSGYSKIGLVGESLGGLCSVLAYGEKINSIVLWAPATKAGIPLKSQAEKLQSELEEKGYVFIEKDNRKFKIGRQYFIERQTVNQQKILSEIKCPVLLIHGDKDDTIPLKQSESAMQYLPEESKLEIIRNADHKFSEHIDELVSISLEWFKKWLK